MSHLHCLFCQQNNKPNATHCSHCGARLIPLDNSTKTELENQKQTLNSIIQNSKMEQLIRQLPADGLALFVAGQQDPIFMAGINTLILGRDSTHTGEFVLDLSRFGRLAHSISRRHAAIATSENGFAVSDLGSTNGTWLNEEILQPGKKYPLQNNDQIKLGLFLLVVCFQSDQGGSMQTVKMFLCSRNRLMASSHTLTPPYLFTQLAPYLQALNDIQHAIATCRKQTGRDITIQGISEKVDGTAVQLEMAKSTLHILRYQVLPWRDAQTELTGQASDRDNLDLKQAIRQLALNILSKHSSEQSPTGALIEKTSAALFVLATSQFELHFS
jgi:pSer/pThr/pTyr-binding forkhead associated (FHA) protein